MLKNIFPMLFIVAGVLMSASCAEIKESGKAIGHATKEIGTSIGHNTRDAAKTVGKETKKAVSDVESED